MSSQDKQPVQQEGVKESQQDRKQDETARQRPAQTDQAIHDAETRRPPRKDDNPARAGATATGRSRASPERKKPRETRGFFLEWWWSQGGSNS